jgi:hypothetical protein
MMWNVPLWKWLYWNLVMVLEFIRMDSNELILFLQGTPRQLDQKAK